ncbi:MAG: hypothetical protein HUJ98_01530 [Bacteroidaceae bacterium]|nr:hypothetical protein [Bacteroidaceae bacterium]
MGNRLHVASTYYVRYGRESHFNWKSAEFHAFLDTVDIYISGTDRCIDPCPWDFEINKEEWKSGMETLRNIDNLTEGHQAEIREAVKSLGVTIEEMLQIMQNYLNESDPTWDYLEFAFI